jgi:polyphosphate kinase
MERNFFRRVEVAFPVRHPNQRERILRDLDLSLSDNCQAWELHPDGHYERVQAGAAKPVNAQAELLATYAAGPGPVT